MPVPAIELSHLTKTFGDRHAVRDVSLAIAPGEILGFLGPNGAGKSTTLRTLLGFMKPTSGQARVRGIDVHAHPVEARRHIGNLPTEFSLENRMTGAEMLRFFADLRGIDTAIPYARELAMRLDADLHRPMRRLSRGNKQKIGIIQALFHRPPVVVLDEPTGGLDPLVQETFLQIIRETRANGQTVFFSSHVLAEVEQVADRVGIIREGELVAIEKAATLTERAWRVVTARLRQGVPPELVARLRVVPGVDQVRVEGASLRFTVQHDVDAVVKLLATAEIAQIEIERPSLEEIFLAYYGRGGAT